MKDLLTKTGMCKELECSESFFDSLPLPRYRIGKRDYYKLADVPAAIEHTKQEPVWESTKQKARRITSTISQSKVLGIGDLQALRKSRTRKRSTTMSAESFC